MADVLRQVREMLGPDALIVSQRTVRREGRLFGRLARPVVEVTAAVDHAPDARPDGGPPAGDRVAPDDSWKGLHLARALVAPMEAELSSLRRSIDRLATETQVRTSGLVADEIDELRRVVRALRAGTPPPATTGGPLGSALHCAGLDAAHAEHLAREATRLAPGDGGLPEALVHALAERLDDRMRPPRPHERTALLCVGPPGAGKTTTLVKLAARSAGAARPPALVTTDVHRAGGDACLRACARELDVPFEAAASAEGLAHSVRRFERRSVLVDTTGRSRRDRDALPELRRLRDALGDRARVCLVLPATHKEIDLRAELGRYGELAPDELVLTKLDESAELGSLCNVLLDADTPPLTWIATGQRVPQDLHVADPGDLARRVLGAGA